MGGELRVLLFGAGGYFGRLLAEELARLPGCSVVAAGRGRVPAPAGLPFVRADLADARSVERALDGAQAAICAAGPFGGLPPSLARACLARGVHYADLADDRGFVARVRALAAATPPRAVFCVAWSTCSALTGLLASLAAQGLDRVAALRSFIAPGNRAPRSASTVAALLSSLGREFPLRGPAGPRTAHGWSEPRDYPFPPPIGTRTGRLADSADHDLIPELFPGAAAEFRVAPELRLLDRAAAGVAAAAAAGLLREPARWAGPLSRATAALGGLGHDWGAVGVEVEGERAGRPCLRRLSLVAERNGPRLAVYPAFVLVRRLLAGQIPGGPAAHAGWIERAALEADCRARGWRLVGQEAGPG